MTLPDYLPPFAIQGKIEDCPLPVLIAHLLDQKMTGMLYLESEGQKPWIYFADGFPAGVFVPKSQDFLGSVLRELGFIDDAAFNESLMRMAKSKRMQGQVLLEMGKIDEEQLERALSMQIARKLARLFTLRTGSYEFLQDEDLPPPLDPIRVNPFALIYNGIRNAYNETDLKAGLAMMVGKACKVSGTFIQRKDLFEFPPEDMEDAELLREFRLPQEFVRGARSGLVAGMMMLLAFQYCGMLEFEDASFAQAMPGVRASPASPASPASATPPPRSAPASTQAASTGGRRPAANAPESPAPRGTGRPPKGASVPPALRSKINEKFEQAKAADFWKVLEVERDATAEVMKKSFLSLTRVYHPDRVAGAGDPELQNRMEVIASKINEAFQTLTDPQARAAYEHKAGAPQRSGPVEPHPEEAKVQFGKAQVFLKKHELVKAIECFKWASELDPKNGDYKAHYLWAESQRPESPEKERVERVKIALIETVKAFPDSFWAVRYLSILFKRFNDEDNYAHCLIQAAKLNKNDVEVAREVRLLKMRKDKEGKKGTFLGFKFK